MGVLNPICLATDGSSIYSFSVAVKSADSKDLFYVLIRSNKTPSHTLSDLSWTLVSAVKQEGLVFLEQSPNSSGDYSCAVDETGIFTVLASRSRESASGSYDQTIRGLQYQPAASGQGEWKNVKTSAGYKWGDSMFIPLFKHKDASGVFTTMQAQLDAYTGHISVAAMDSASLTMNQNPSIWAIDEQMYGVPGAVAFTNSHLYSIGYKGYYSDAYLVATPLSGPSTTPPTVSGTGYNATIVRQTCDSYYSKNLWMHSLQETIVIMCRMTEKRNQIYVFDGTSVKSLPLFVSGITPLGMVPMTGPSGSYVFMADINGVYSVPLTGASAGALISGYQQVNITDNYGATPSGSNRPTSSSTTGSGTGSGPGPNQDPTEITNRTKPILIGVFCGAIVLAIIVSCIRAYKRRRLERKNTAASVEAPLPLPPTPMKEADSRGGFQYPGQGMQTPVYPPSNHFYQQQEHQQQQQQQLMSQEYAASTPYQWPATLSPDYQQEKIGYDPAALYPIPPVPSPLKATPPSPENVVPVTKATPRLNSPHTGYVDGDGTGRTIRGPMDYGYNEGVNNDGSSPMRTVQTLPAIRHPQVRD